MGVDGRRGVGQESKIRPQEALFPMPSSLGFIVPASGGGGVRRAAITKSEIVDTSYSTNTNV